MDEQHPQTVYPPASYLEATRGQNGLLGGFQAYIERLAGPLNGGALPPDLPTFDEGLEVARILDAAHLASRERRRVRLSEIA